MPFQQRIIVGLILAVVMFAIRSLPRPNAGLSAGRVLKGAMEDMQRPSPRVALEAANDKWFNENQREAVEEYKQLFDLDGPIAFSDAMNASDAPVILQRIIDYSCIHGDVESAKAFAQFATKSGLREKCLALVQSPEGRKLFATPKVDELAPKGE
jgi:hypothetical protein